MDKFDRLQMLHRIFKSRRRAVSAVEIAKQLECSTKTVTRSIEQMRVFPTTVGMNRTDHALINDETCVPRTCWDKLVTTLNAFLLWPCSPKFWGSIFSISAICSSPQIPQRFIAIPIPSGGDVLRAT